MKYATLLLPALLASLFVSCETVKPAKAMDLPPATTDVVVMGEGGATRTVTVPTHCLPASDAEGRDCIACDGTGVTPAGNCKVCYGLGSIYR